MLLPNNEEDNLKSEAGKRSYKRDAFIQSILKRCYVDEPGYYISNGLSTSLVCFPSDRAPSRREHLAAKIRHAMEYSPSFNDIEEINALAALAPANNSIAQDYTALGLYLYLADECSRMKAKGKANKDTTFLTELRDAGFTLAMGRDIGSFEFRTDKLLTYIKSFHVTNNERKLLIENINALLGTELKQPLTIETLGAAKDSLVTAIAAKYPDKPDKLKAFLVALKERMKDQYPLQNYNSVIITDEKRADLHTRLLTALHNIGMENTKAGVIVDEWMQNGSFSVCGEQNGTSPKDSKEVTGAYARLARDIASERRYLALHLAISYALGIKSTIENKSAEEAYAYTASLTQPTLQKPINPEVHAAILEGNQERFERIEDAIESQMGPVTSDAERAVSKLNREETMKGILKFLPEPALEILHLGGYSIAYTNSYQIGDAYPEREGGQRIPGRWPNNFQLRANKGIFEPQFNTLFMSNGIRSVNGQNIPADVFSQKTEERYQVIAQSLAHEIFHFVLYNMSDKHNTNVKEQEKLKAATEALAEKLKTRGTQLPFFFNEKLKTLSVNTLAEVLNLNSDIYKYADRSGGDKGGEDQRWFEAICNIYGLMCTEFPYPPKDKTNNPYAQLPELNELARSINEAVLKARAVFREEHKDIPLPSAGVSPC